MATEDENLNVPATSEQEHENNASSREEPSPFQEGVPTITTTIQQDQPEPEQTASPAESEMETDIETEQMELVPESREITAAPSVSEELQFDQAELESNQPSPFPYPPSSALQSKEQTPEIEPQEEQTSSSTNHEFQTQIPTLKRKLEYEGFEDQQQLTTSETVSRDRTESPEPTVQRLAKKLKTQSPTRTPTPTPTPQPIQQLTTETSTKEITPAPGTGVAAAAGAAGAAMSPSHSTSATPHHQTGTSHGHGHGSHSHGHGHGHGHRSNANGAAPVAAKSNRPKYEIIDGSRVRVFLNKYVTRYLTHSLDQIVNAWESGELVVPDIKPDLGKKELKSDDTKVKMEEAAGVNVDVNGNEDSKDEKMDAEQVKKEDETEDTSSGKVMQRGDVLIKLGEMLIRVGNGLNSGELHDSDDEK
ncbi:unnamed protein product [Ambrosiozyma monospora]|uniref:Unnamed protein product n=1 Tax=Ambrosiozyma monospora TaxID=43982 RepID=A0ACB5SRV1_AMBMO|nr:unnamed protein product [Ambrosiozyma monospora]